MQNPFRSNSNAELSISFLPAVSRALQFSNEVEAQRRRKGSGPTGRADAPVFRPGGGSSGGTGGSGSTGGTGGGWLPTGGGSRVGGLKIPGCVGVIIIILILLFGGKDLISSLFGSTGDTTYTNDNTYPSNDQNYVATEVPTVQAVTGFTPPANSKSGSWTVMLYQDADDQVLEEDIFTDFNEAERIGSTDKVNIVAQLDRYRGAFAGDGNWTTTRRYYVTKDDDLNTINSQLVAEGESNMSDPATLVDFATWAMKTFPADHYVLILSDHGMGWPGGWTDPTSTGTSERAPIAQAIGNAMYMDQVESALGQIRSQAGIDKFDILGMDACLMGQLEVLSALEPHARYAITSEETEPALGWAYTAFLQALTQNPGMSAADLSKLVVQSYINSDQRIVDDQARADYAYQLGAGSASASQLAQALGKDATLTAIDLSKVPALMGSVNNLAYTMQSADQSEIASARSYSLAFTSVFGSSVPKSYIDLGSFVQILAQQSSDGNVQQQAGQVLAGIQQAVIANKAGSAKRGATGVSIYYPTSSLYRSAMAGPQSYTIVANTFTSNSLWDDFLAFHYNGRSFDSATREAVIPSSDLPSRTPGIGQFTVSDLRLSSDIAAPGQPVTLRADISGTNIGNIYLFVGYYDQASNYIYVADTDFLESPDTQQVDGVYFPQWGKNGDFTVKFDWDPYIFTISDGTNSAVALFTPQQYGATAEDAIYSVDGAYTFKDSGSSLSARLNFRNGQLVSIFGITGQNDTGAPHEITAQVGDTFTVQEKWLQLDSSGKVVNTVYQPGTTTLTFSGQPFTWQETYAAAGTYMVGFVVTDLDGNARETYGQVTVK